MEGGDSTGGGGVGRPSPRVEVLVEGKCDGEEGEEEDGWGEHDISL